MDLDDFTDPVDEELLCGICHGVMVHPKCCKLGHCWCQECIESWASINPTCPSDGMELNVSQLSDLRPITNMISKLKCRCSQGTCTWIGELQNRDFHWSDECGFTEVSCSNEGCFTKLLRCDMDNHIKHTCEHRVETCPYCSANVKKYLLHEHLKECDCVLIYCASSCNESFLRKDAIHHETTCPEKLVSCPLVRMGCVCVEIPRKDLVAHQNDNENNNHNEIMMQYIEKLEAKCDKQALKFSKQAEVCEVQAERLKELVNENAQLMTSLCEKEEELKQLKGKLSNGSTKPSSVSSFQDVFSRFGSAVSRATSQEVSGSNHAEGSSTTCPAKHVLVPFTVPNNTYSCNGCNVRMAPNSVVNSCRLCNHDLCAECFQKKNKPEPRPQLNNCPGGHGLSNLIVPNKTFFCDLCSCMLPQGSTVKDCRLCNFDLCNQCYCQEPSVALFASKNEPVKCPKSHLLLDFIVPNQSFVCDQCSLRLAIKTCVKRCRQCNYDLCTHCATSIGEKDSVA